MKKKDFIDRVADKAELTRAVAAKTVEAIFDAAEGAIVEAIHAGEHISLPGFGKFRSKTRGARRGRNPRTGKEINIPARTVMHFAPGKGVADTLAGKKSARKSASKSGGRKSAGTKSAGSKSTAKSASSKSGGAGKSASKGASKSASKGASKSAAKGSAAKGAGSKSSAKSASKGASKSSGAKRAGSKSAGSKSAGR